MQQILNYINGRFEPAKSQLFIDNYNPATGKIYSQLPNSDAEDVEFALASAEKAYDAWRLTSSEERFKILNKIAELIDQKNESLALAESIDQGKPLWLAKHEMIRSAQNFRFLLRLPCSLHQRVITWRVWRLIILFANPLVLWVASALGICPCICFLGKLHQLWLLAIV
jgi:acyl-CoA reductase-like NAD-dependent aldehyde dehydrogenase